MVIDKQNSKISRSLRMHRFTELWDMCATRVNTLQNLIKQHFANENLRPLALEAYETSHNEISIRAGIW
jgi:hypothetical protein